MTLNYICVCPPLDHLATGLLEILKELANNTLQATTKIFRHWNSLRSRQDNVRMARYWCNWLTRRFSTTNNTENKLKIRRASSRKPFRFFSSFGDTETFSHTITSFFPTTFVPDLPMKMRGTPFLSMVCGPVSVTLVIVLALRTATDWTQSLIPTFMVSMTAPVRLSKT